MFLSLDSGAISALPCTTSCLLYKHKALILIGYHCLSSNTVSCILIWSLTLTFTACWASEQTSFYNSHKHQTSQCEHFHAVKIPNVRAEVLTRVIVFCALTTANDLLYWYWSGKLNMKVIRHVSAVWLHQGCENSLWSNGLKTPLDSWFLIGYQETRSWNRSAAAAVRKGSKQHIHAETNTHKHSPASAVQDDKLWTSTMYDTAFTTTVKCI